MNELARLAQPQAGYVVVGAGKTGMDACIWLLEQGVDPDRIRWIMPRDSWVLDRANVQSGDEFFMNTWGTMTRQLEAVVAAENVQDLMLRLEAAGEWMRVDHRVQPTVYHGAILPRVKTATRFVSGGGRAILLEVLVCIPSRVPLRAERDLIRPDEGNPPPRSLRLRVRKGKRAL